MVDSEDYSLEDTWMDDPPPSAKRGGRGEKKRRFTEEQVKSLELMFEAQAKLEPRKKLELARDLGLHPRQVAIWFQNKRARWKSKQLEREYSALQADYDALLAKFESLKNEKQLLSKQLQKLAELMEKPMEARVNSMPADARETRLASTSDDDEENRKEADMFNEEASPVENFCLLQTNWPSEQPSITPQWWEFWPTTE